jgi:hypothetical protein
MAARIGGNIGDIQDTSADISQAGSAATSAGSDASSFAQRMDAEITDVTTMLEQHFTSMADALRERITATKNRLAGTDWEGTSQAEATRAEAALHNDVNTVLANALDSTAQFKAFMMSQASDFTGMVQGDFNTIMANVDAAYQDLSQASRKFAENLQLADETIKFAG